MADITVELIKTLRDKTNAGMMDCKAALAEADGDLDAAETVLRKKGIASAGKKASRTASEGVVASKINAEGRTGVLAELNCETDFVAKNDNFQSFVTAMIDHLAGSSAEEMESLLAEPFTGEGDGTVEDFVKAKIAELGENIVARRFERYTVEEGVAGAVSSYIHLQGKVGVLVEVGCSEADTVGNEKFRELVKDITLHIAAASPVCVGRDEVPSELVEKEREIYLDQVKDKPENIIEKIVSGKIDKYYSTICLSEQGFVKDPDKTVGEVVKSVAAEVGDEGVEVRRFVRYAVGEEV
ncbi:MAG: translation elongation factor Ts [Verrucomicrobiota bacterium]